MFKTITNFFRTIETKNEDKGINMKASIEQVPDGRFAIVERASNNTVATYARKRDAVRGATRRGFVVFGV